MGIKFDPITKSYTVTYTKRHPLTKVPYPLKRVGIKSENEAKKTYNELVILTERKFQEKRVPLWGDLLEEYFKYLLNVDITNTTRYNREKLLRYHTIPTWENKPVNLILHSDILSLLNLRFQENKESYRKTFIKFVRGVFDYAVEQQYIIRNPTPKLKFKIASKIKAVLSQEQIMILLRKAQEQDWSWYPHYTCAVYLGLRNGELYALKWHQVDLVKRQVLVNCSWSSKDGFKSTKSGHDRIVEIPKPLLPLLQELKLRSAESDFVLPRMGRWDRGEQAHDLRLFLKSNGLPEVNFHNLRASWATMMLNRGADPARLMVMGGWSDLKTMMIYIRKAGIDIKGSTAVLDDMQTHGLNEAKVINFNTL